MFTKIIKEGNFVLRSGVRSKYDYDYGSMTDAMNEAYCEILNRKLTRWQDKHGRFDVVVGIETEGIRIGYRLSRIMHLPFHILPHKITELASLEIPRYPGDTHWLIIDDIVTTGLEMMRAVEFLEIEDRPETITFACMIRRNPKNLDYSALDKHPHKEQFFVPDKRFDVIDKRLVSLYCEAE